MAATIRIADTVHPSHATKSDCLATGSTAVDDGIHHTHSPRRTPTGRSTSSEENKDGIYNMRDITRTFSRSTSKDKRGTWHWKAGDKAAEDDDPGIQQSGDFRQKEVGPG